MWLKFIREDSGTRIMSWARSREIRVRWLIKFTDLTTRRLKDEWVKVER